ncbi:hypothetical protein AB2T96_18650 [Clostridium butyricum]|uniref:hypothetical protein n=1 Tax=Clostridium TaxID=1485 RepID=UPI0002CA4E0E|nr:MULTISPECIES: hypothetical protein [Clostridium]MDU4852802.1 hypothetical protein [Clostridioides difficile]DAL62014.1 MAG TPA_asm: hypothetical protein [Caudoviricetes sp.]EMU52295.1 hypothetical protein CBDKU1_37270 [Clostridium butyricum DKU-01]KJZ83932.1 hypothetical protein ClosIBUN125C_CONTIG68g03823 [Clostridium sp. IBUN125C]KJZ87953.1 hypothetical protein ClosIBUN13A_CONTIG46g00508 [Clostridium sp. IBUN13A]
MSVKVSIWQFKQDISDLDAHKVSMTDEAKDAAERVIDDLEAILNLATEFKYSIKE